MTVDGFTLWFTYDANGTPLTVIYNDITYYYVTNLQGDIVAILDSTGTKIVSYTYDAWGNILSTTGTHALTELNPLRYRGYVYDTETGLYYLQSRYYNPQWGRFISADGQISDVGGELLGNNMFAYCFNNPINMSDPDGKWPIGIIARCLASIIINKLLGLAEKALTEKHDVPLYYQGGTGLCWAYCQMMVEDYKSGTIRTQAEADKRAMELGIAQNGIEKWYKGGWPTNCEEYNSFGTPVPARGMTTLLGLYLHLKTSGPVYAYYANSNSAHLVVVTGVNLCKGVVYTNNPWGIAGEQTYAEFLNGFTNGPLDGSLPFKYYFATN